jgi:hypothetical protein
MVAFVHRRFILAEKVNQVQSRYNREWAIIVFCHSFVILASARSKGLVWCLSTEEYSSEKPNEVQPRSEVTEIKDL